MHNVPNKKAMNSFHLCKEAYDNMDFCLVTEIDINRKLGGAITNDSKTISCLRKLGKVDAVYLETERYKTTWLAFPFFVRQIIKGSRNRYQIYFSRGLIASCILILLKPVLKGKIVHNALSVPFPSIETKYSTRTSIFKFVWFSLMRFLENAVTHKADAVTVAADTYARQLVKNGVTESRVQTVNFYVEDEFFHQPLKLEAEKTFTFGYAGGFQPYHELLPMIEAFDYLLKTNDNFKLHLVGDGALRPLIEREVSLRKLKSNVKFFGKVPHSSIPKFLSSVDSFIILTPHGISTSLLEAAAAGKAIIALKRKGDITLEQYFRDRKELLYAKDASPTEIRDAMKLLSEDSSLRKTLSVEARKVAKQHFSEEVCLNQLRELIRRLANSNGMLTHPTPISTKNASQLLAKKPRSTVASEAKPQTILSE